MVRRFVLAVFDRTPAGKFMALSFVVRMPSPHCPGTGRLSRRAIAAAQSVSSRRSANQALRAGEAVGGDQGVEVVHGRTRGVAEDDGAAIAEAKGVAVRVGLRRRALRVEARGEAATSL